MRERHGLGPKQCCPKLPLPHTFITVPVQKALWHMFPPPRYKSTSPRAFFSLSSGLPHLIVDLIAGPKAYFLWAMGGTTCSINQIPWHLNITATTAVETSLRSSSPPSAKTMKWRLLTSTSPLDRPRRCPQLSVLARITSNRVLSPWADPAP